MTKLGATDGGGPSEDLRALVVEDDPANAQLLAVILGEDGWNVQTVRSAEEALNVLKAFRPHVILLDLALPMMNGFAFARMLKSDPETRSIVIIAVTAADSLPRALEAGCAACVRKPIDVASLPELVRTHLGRVR